jgi:hypothetical protein
MDPLPVKNTGNGRVLQREKESPKAMADGEN